MPPFDLLGIVLALIYILLPLFVLRAYRRIRLLEGRASALEAPLRRLRTEPGEQTRQQERASQTVEATPLSTRGGTGPAPSPGTAAPHEAPPAATGEAGQPAAGVHPPTPWQEAPAAARPEPVTNARAPSAAGAEPPLAPAPDLPPTPAVPAADPWAATTDKGWYVEDSELYRRAKAWLLGGNTVARLGIVVLFFGVAFFLKYAVEQGWFPTELRLAAAALGGIVLTGIGWRMLERRRGYALVLEGGGIGIVYLTVFAAIDTYGVLPAGPGLVLMVALVALASAVAVLQDARGLAVLAAVGGFLAPVLISRGGSHVALFTYYAVLDLGILGIAWFKAWRELNLVGFAFTFVIGALWGHRFYQPEHFWTTQPFLVFYFLLYVAVPVLFARRQPPNLRGYVDGSLVFGVPLVAFGLQHALVRDTEYGLAISAVVVGLFYAALATALWRRERERAGLLAEAFVALAVVFGTVAIPLAVDGRWTGAAWAIEGAALVWIGARQGRALARYAGLVLQLGAGIAFLAAHGLPSGGLPVLNALYLGAVMVSLAGLTSAYVLHRHAAVLTRIETGAALSSVALVWGLAWWYGAGANEIFAHAGYRDRLAGLLGLVTATSALVTWLRSRLDWADLRYPPLLLLPFMAYAAVIGFFGDLLPHAFARWGLLAWPAAFAVHLWSLRRLEDELPAPVPLWWHGVGLWVAVFVAGWEAWWLTAQAVPTGWVWRHVAPALVVAVVLGALPRLAGRLAWPIGRQPEAYGRVGQLPLAVALGAWTLISSFERGDPAPLPYLPLLNPLELGQAFALVTLARWWWREAAQRSVPWHGRGVAALSFVALNGLIARAFHVYGGVPFDFSALWASPGYQATVSIVWAAAALAVMVAATRLQRRGPWMFGAALLGAVVVKLFLVDLAGLGTVARILSFIVVGLLMLLIGYLSPLPPRSQEAASR
jgi:uncharacterized membrane protein